MINIEVQIWTRKLLFLPSVICKSIQEASLPSVLLVCIHITALLFISGISLTFLEHWHIAVNPHLPNKQNEIKTNAKEHNSIS